jgi:hypothetical protein
MCRRESGPCRRPSYPALANRLARYRFSTMSWHFRQSDLRKYYCEQTSQKPLGPAWIGVIAAVTGCGWCTGPRRRCRVRYESNRGARGDRRTGTPSVARWPHPATRMCDTWTHQCATARDGPVRHTAARPTTVVRRTAPPCRTTTSMIGVFCGLFCLSRCCSVPLPPVKADAFETAVAKPAKPSMTAQAMPLKVFAAQPH